MNKVGLQELAGGALQEKTQSALEEVVANMQDPNTPWKNKREVIIKLKFTQNEDRNDSRCEISVEKKLAQVKPVETKFAHGKDLRTGEVFVEEYGNEIRGQLSIKDFEKEKNIVIEGKSIDTETGEIKETETNVTDFRAKKA